jgi:N-acetylmuramoyl-L-alanine amidase
VFADSNYTMPLVDSVFVFGSLGRGDARLRVNGREVEVFRTGAWLAWLPRPAGPTARFDFVAWSVTDTIRGTLAARVAESFAPPPTPVWTDPGSFDPSGDLWVRRDEGYRLRVRAVAGATVRAILPAGDTVVFREDGLGDGAAPRRVGRYVAWHAGTFGPDPGHVLSPDWRPPATDSSWVSLEVIREADTVRTRWPLRVGIVDAARPPLALVADDTAGTGTTDGVLAGRPVPFGTYHWFFPNGTVAPVSGRSNGQVRLQLSRRSVAWVDGKDVVPLPPGTPLPLGVAGSMRLRADSSSVTLFVPVSRRVPYRVDEETGAIILRLYGAAADMDWIRYRDTDPFVRLVSFHQPAEDEVDIRVDLSEPVWGYRTRWSGSELVLEIRRPPVVDSGNPLNGRRIAVDAGHPPAGSRGPTGITEAEVNLGVARKLRTLLQERGADVVMTRDGESGVGLVQRTQIAEDADAELLVSIHGNALADGRNPFANGGTTVFYYHPRAVPLARAIDRALVRQLGFPDLGVARGDLHLARPTWMPSVLVEGLFMMIPEQEAVLVGEEGQWRYARGVFEGIVRFLAGRAPDDR